MVDIRMFTSIPIYTLKSVLILYLTVYFIPKHKFIYILFFSVYKSNFGQNNHQVIFLNRYTYYNYTNYTIFIIFI